MRNYLITVFSYLIFFFFGQLSAQDYIADVEHYTIEQGLSNRAVFDVHQDQMGFIWLATKYGLNRFDGRAFKWWTKEKQGLSSNEIHHILEDAEGYLWLFTVPNWYYSQAPTHISLIEPKTGRVLSLEEKFGENLPFDLIGMADFNQGEDHTLYFTSRDLKQVTYRPEAGFQALAFSYPFLSNSFVKTSEGAIISADFRQIEKHSLKKVDAQNHLLWESSVKDSFNFIKTVLPLAREQYLVLTEVSDSDLKPKLFFLKDEQTLNLQRLNQLDEIIQKVFFDWAWGIRTNPQTQYCWVYGNGNMQVHHLEKGLLMDFKKRQEALTKSIVYDMYFDEQGHAWIGTSNGLYKVQLYANPFQQYLSSSFDENNEYTNYSCRGIWAEGEQLLVNTYKGRVQIDKNNPTEFFQFPWARSEMLGRHHLKHPLALIKNKESQYLFSDVVIVQQNPDGQVTQIWDYEYSLDKSKRASLNWSLYVDEKGQIWGGTDDGLMTADTASAALDFVPPQAGFEALTESTIHAFVPSKQHFVWLCTTSGLYSWSPEKGILNRFWTGGEGNTFLPHDNILHLFEEADSNLWIATGGGGLVHFNPNQTMGKAKNAYFQQFTIADGLSNNHLYAVYADEFGRLWMSSDYGIMQFNKSTKNVQTYLPKNGLPHYEFNRISHFQDDQGHLYFGGLNGVVEIDPKDFQTAEDKLEAALVITDFEQMDGATEELVNKTSELQETHQIVVKPQDPFFRLQFSMLDYDQPELVRYAWKIEGVHESWNHIRENFIQVIGLPYGEHQLKIKGQAANGNWSKQELHISITVLKPLYLQIWFLFLLGFTILVTLFLLYQWRTAQLKRSKQKLKELVRKRTETIEQQAEELRQLDKIKSRFFANVSHELRTPLTLILGPISSALKSGDLTNRNFTLLKKAQQSGQDLLKLIASILDLSKMESGKLELHETPGLLFNLIRRIISAFESHAQREGIHFILNYRAEEKLQLLVDQEKLEIILNNLLSNAIKFTPRGGEISVEINDLANAIQIIVKDTGRGIPQDDMPHIFNRFYQSSQPDAPTEGGTGIGLALSQELVQLMGGSIWVESELGEGSRFAFKFPRKEILGVVEADATSESPVLISGNLQAANPEFQIPASKLTDGHLEQSFSEIGIKKKKRQTVLIVEDNHSLRNYIQTILDPFYTILTAENGQIALQRLEKCAKLPSIIISDIMMPQMDGFQLLTHLKEKDAYRLIPVIMLTARADIQDKLKALRIGVDDYLLKPFIEEELLARIENLLIHSQNRINATPDTRPKKSVSSDNTPSISKLDLEWLQTQEAFLKEQLSDSHLTVQVWAQKTAMSIRQLQRQLKQLTGLSPQQYLLELRLAQARTLLENQVHRTVSEVAYSVGFASAQTLTRNFKKRFGKLPSAYF